MIPQEALQISFLTCNSFISLPVSRLFPSSASFQLIWGASGSGLHQLFPFASGSCRFPGLGEQDSGLCLYSKAKAEDREGGAQGGGTRIPFHETLIFTIVQSQGRVCEAGTTEPPSSQRAEPKSPPFSAFPFAFNSPSLFSRADQQLRLLRPNSRRHFQPQVHALRGQEGPHGAAAPWPNTSADVCKRSPSLCLCA